MRARGQHLPDDADGRLCSPASRSADPGTAGHCAAGINVCRDNRLDSRKTDICHACISNADRWRIVCTSELAFAVVGNLVL